MISHLTHRHFRNIWYFFNDDFNEFKKLIELTWPEYAIELPEFQASDNKVNMYFKEKNITREIYWAGHGFQIWLQLMTFLVKCGNVDTLILDEPDIYLHTDMQKKLVDISKSRSNQVILATHAVDIIEEVGPHEIITINKNTSKAIRLSSIDDVQTCITQLGSDQNLKLVNFIRNRSCLFVEGNDFKYLKIIARKLNEHKFAKEDGFSVVPLEGFSNWRRLVGIDWIFTNVFGEKVSSFVVLDRDYYSPEEIKEIKEKMKSNGVDVHIWKKKEIENIAVQLKTLQNKLG
jgi:predicted ATP-dependent endonuclease of OLD family